MSNQTIVYVVAAGCGVLSLAAYVAFILVPAWTAYSRVWERMLATVMTLYVLAAFIGLGLAGGAAVVWFWSDLV
jgi:hypothetical protein